MSERSYHGATCCSRFRKEVIVLFNGAYNTFYLRLYGVGHIVKIAKEETRCSQYVGYFPMNSEGSFICTIPQIGFVLLWCNFVVVVVCVPDVPVINITHTAE